MIKALLLAVTVVQGPPQQVGSGARTPAWSRDGRVAFAAAGDLWVVSGFGSSAPGAPVRVTRGPAWDRDPAWTPAGELVFSSDRSGDPDLWRVRVGPDGAPGEPERLTRDPAPETEPVVLPDGTIVFVRGVAAASDLWRLSPDGRETRLTNEPGADVSPTVSADGRRVAWLAGRIEGDEVRVMDVASGEARGFEAAGVFDVAWSPADDRLALARRGLEPGIWVTGLSGRPRSLVSENTGTLAWSPEGAWLALGAEPAPDVGYNGDPDRVTDRSGPGPAENATSLWLLPAPPPASPRTVSLELGDVAAADRLAEYDRVGERVARLYAPGPGSSRDAAAWTQRWRAARERHRAQAARATNREELDAVIHALLLERPPLRAAARGRAAVSSANRAATAAGVEILAAGGNVVDAAVAVSFAIGVVEPDASGLGGYGEMLIHLEGMSEPVAIEFMTRIPEAFGETVSTERPEGPRSPNVPGTVAGMELAWRKYGSGRVSWARVLAPAIRLAENGYVVTDGLATTLRREWLEFSRYESSRALFFPDGRPLVEGDTLRNPDLARTLRAIAEGGADAFYRGDIARTIAADLGAHGNLVRESDLARYFAVERKPVHTTYRGHDVYSGPPPVTGGPLLAAKLNLLEQAPRGRSMTDDAAELHALIETWKLQPSTGGRIADPDQWPVDVSPFESKDTARARWRCFDPARATPPGAVARGCATASGGGEAEADEETGRSTGTTAFAVADADGNAVAVTQTLGTWGGNFYVTPGLGFLYNDKAVPYRGPSDRFGAPLPFGRVGTVIAPTLVYDGTGAGSRPMLAVGAAGNAWITAAVYTAVVGVVDFGLGPQQALELPRMLVSGGGFGSQRGEPVIQMEAGFDPAAIRALEAMGHRFRAISLPGELRMGYGAAVLIRDGRATAGADPRRAGAAGAVR
jgi:gamma-glutamyltranspeptidase